MAQPNVRVNPTLTVLDMYNAPPPNATGIRGLFNKTWSGYLILDKTKPFALPPTSYPTVHAEYIVPVAQQAPGTCKSTWNYASAWIGVDGSSGLPHGKSTDIAQAGILMGASCTETNYYAWYEWYPNLATEIDNGTFPVRPGDVIDVALTVVDSIDVKLQMINYTEDKVVSLDMPAPPKVSLLGDSVEWIIETPTVSGKIWPLTYYTQMAWSQNYATAAVPDYPNYSPDPGGAPSGLSICDQSALNHLSSYMYSITMGSKAQEESVVGATNPDVLCFVDANSDEAGDTGSDLWFSNS